MDTTKTFSTIEIPYGLPQCMPRYDQYGLMDRTGKVTPLHLGRILKLDDSGWIVATVIKSSNTRVIQKLIGPKGQIIPSTDKVEVVNFLTENRAPVRFISDSHSPTSAEANNKLPYSYCTETGEILKTRFDQVSPFSDGVAAVRIGKSVGFIGLDGQFLPNSKQVECQFSDGLSQGYLPAYVNGRWGYLDTHGHWLVEPIFDSAEPFKNDFAQVGIHNLKTTINPSQKSNNFTYIDKNGKLFDQRFYLTKPFAGGYAVVFVLLNEQDLSSWGLIDRAGRWVLEPKYSSIGPLIGSSRLIFTGPYNGSNSIGSTRLLRDKERVGVFANGKIIVPPKYAHVGKFSEGLASYRSPDSNKVGFIDQDGKIVIPPQFPFAGDFSEGLAAVGYPAVKINGQGKMGFIDRKGTMVIAPKFDSSGLQYSVNSSRIQFHDGICLVDRSFLRGRYMESEYGYINKAGQWISPIEITQGYPFKMGRGLIRYYPHTDERK